MHTALNEVLASLPDETKVFVSLAASPAKCKILKNIKPGHEYTKQNVKFLTTVLQNEAVRNLQTFAEENRETQGKFTIGDEKESSIATRALHEMRLTSFKEYNAFMRLGVSS